MNADETTLRLRSLYLGGIGLDTAAARVGVDVSEARRRLRETGIDLTCEPTVEELRGLRVAQGLTVAAIAERFGLSRKQVQRRLAAAGIRRSAVSARARRAGLAHLGEGADAAFRKKVLRLYRSERQSVRQIAAHLDSDPRTVWRELEAAGVRRRPRGTAASVIPAGELRRLYVSEGLSVAEIARRLEVSTATVGRNLDRYRIARRAPRPIPKRRLVELYVKEGLGVRATAAVLGCRPGGSGGTWNAGGSRSTARAGRGGAYRGWLGQATVVSGSSPTNEKPVPGSR